jgi:NAD(P)-dependent dehydrogenase (short-subunit alcohol dehydrogenase family)
VLAADAVGTISVLVNNVARDDRHSLEDVTAAYWDEMMAVNLRHQFFAAQAVRAGMASLGGGSIVNLGSTSWIRAEGGMPVYTTAKAAVWGLTRSLARDLGPFNVRVNAVAPGWVMTERQRERWLTPESEQRLLEDQCLREKLQPSDVARLVLWLAADDSRLIPGQQFIVDPGRV